MKKNKKIKRTPKYAFGADAILNWGGMSGIDRANTVIGGIGAVGSMVGSATNGQPVTAGGMIGGAATGAAAGAALGGVPGAIVGGGLGLLTSSIGTSGSVNEQTGEITNPSGIAGMFGHSKGYLRQKSGRIKSGNIARLNAELIASDYYQDNGYNGITMARGGIVPSTNAYLDDGELLRTPDGVIGSIPEEGKPTDSNLLNVPVGTQVLSDKIKVPGTNKTFAEMGKKLMKKSNKKANDVYAENSQMLNERNNQIAYLQLLNQQEALKNRKNISKKSNKYSDGSSNVTDEELNQLIPGLTRYGRNTQDFTRPSLANMANVANMKKIPTSRINNKPTSYIPLKNGSTYDLIDSIAALAGPVGNIFAGRPELVDTYSYNPVYGPTNYDINPVLNEAALSNSIARYNMANINPSTGANMAFGLQSAVNRNRAIASAYSQKNNAENQMAFNNALIANQWGQQYANARHVAATELAQNDAAVRNIRRQGFGDLSTRILLINKDERLTNRDSAMLDAMLPYLEYGMTSNQLTGLYNKLKKRR